MLEEKKNQQEVTNSVKREIYRKNINKIVSNRMISFRYKKDNNKRQQQQQT